jgi:predicted nucleic acid-binding protein
MRLVVDTNVFVSAVLKANSLPFHVVRWLDRHGGLLQSAATEEELLTAAAVQCGGRPVWQSFQSSPCRAKSV